jgi:L-fuculose-phosphate aldolase
MEYGSERKLLCTLGSRLWQRGFVAANDGNLSLRLAENLFLITPAGVSKGFMTPEMMLLVDERGQVREENGYRPSSELALHLHCYRLRPDARGVVHAHPPAATAFACARIPLTAPILGETLLSLGEIPVAPYGRTGTDELPRAIAPLVSRHNGILLSNHGALTLGDTPTAAYYRMESLEHTALIHLYARSLGGGVPLPQEEADALRLLGGQPG